MERLRLYDMRLSRLPRVVGGCSSDIVTMAEWTNTAQRRLLYCKEAADEGFHGTYAEIAFNVSRANPYFTTPRGVARLEAANVCRRPVPIQNQFYEYLQFGNGRLPKLTRFHCHSDILQIYQRNFVPTFVDLPAGPQIIQIFPSDPTDADGIKRVLLQGLDQNGVTIYSRDGATQVLGNFVTIGAPFVASPTQMTQITGIQKDMTNGPIQFFAMDASTGAQTLLLTMEPSEQTAWYRRYYFDRLPFNCCHTFPPIPPTEPTTVQVSAIAKLDLIPVQVDTDYLLFQNIEAIIEEASSARYSEIDSASAKSMAAERHKQAVGLLNGELTHVNGLDEPAIRFQPFGSARLSRVRIGMI